MDFGMPTLLELNTLEENIALCKELGLSFVEINCNVPEFQVENMDIDHLLHLRQSSGIYFTFHLDEYLSVTDPNPTISEAYIQSVVNSIEFAKKARIPVMTMHFLNGVVFTLPDKKVYVYEKYSAYYLERLRHFRDRVHQAVGDSHIKVCIENVTGFESYMKDGIDLLLQDKAFGLTYDCGHNHRYHQVDNAFLTQHQDRIAHMHLHDCKGSNDHLPLGYGELDLKEELKFVEGKAQRVVIEVKTVEGLRKSVESMHLLNR
jgi:sugar phosphate isomerase/epimerase